MDRTIEKIVSSLREKRIVSFFYKEEKTFIQVSPFYLFQYGQDLHLIVRERTTEDIVVYKLNEISNVEITPLYFKEPLNPLKMYLQYNRAFKKEYVRPVNISDINLLKAAKTIIPIKDKIERLSEYYTSSIRKEELINLVLEVDLKNNKEYYQIPNRISEQLIRFRSDEYSLDENFKNFYQTIKEKLKSQPDLPLYLGYPIVKVASRHYPVMFFSLIYNEESNLIKMNSNDIFINGRFLDEVEELTSFESYKIKESIFMRKHSNILEIQNHIKNLTENQEVVGSGIIFLQIESKETKEQIEKLKELTQKKSLTYSVPFKSILNAEKIILPPNKKISAGNVVSINETQRKIIENSFQPLILVQEPLGTEKEELLVNLSLNEVMNDKKILITSSNIKLLENLLKTIHSKGQFLGVLNLDNYPELSSIIQNNFRTNVLEYDSNNSEKFTYHNNQFLEKMRELESKISEFTPLEEKQKELEKTKSQLEKNIKNQEINVVEIENLNHLEKKKPTKLLEILKQLNHLSVLCEKNEIESMGLIWRILSYLGFDFRKYKLDFYKKEIERSGINSNQFDYHFFDEFNLQLNRYITVIQYILVKQQFNQIEKEIHDSNLKILREELNKIMENRTKIFEELLQERHSKNIKTLSEKQKQNIVSELQKVSSFYDLPTSIIASLNQVYPIILTSEPYKYLELTYDEHIDLVVLDEAEKRTIPSSLPISFKSKRLMIIGDNQQSIKHSYLSHFEDNEHLSNVNMKAARERYSFPNQSFYHLVNRFIGTTNKYLLTENSKSEPRIIQFINKHFYDEKLIIKTKEDKNKLSGMHLIDNEKLTTQDNNHGKSNFNKEEIELLFNYIEKNFDYFKDKSISIVTPFRKQKVLFDKKIIRIKNNTSDVLKQNFYKNINICVLDKFNEKEKDVIFFSSAISHGATSNTLDWLNEQKYSINSIVSATKLSFVLIGNVEFIKRRNGVLKDLVDYIENLNEDSHTETMNTSSLLKQASGKTLNEVYSHTALNTDEQKFYDELENVIKNHFPQLEIGKKIRITDIVQINSNRISENAFKYSLMAHIDFVIFDSFNNNIPLMGIELEKRNHRTDERIKKNDDLKLEICKNHDLTLVKIKYFEYPSQEELKEILEESIPKKKLD